MIACEAVAAPDAMDRLMTTNRTVGILVGDIPTPLGWCKILCDDGRVAYINVKETRLKRLCDVSAFEAQDMGVESLAHMLFEIFLDSPLITPEQEVTLLYHGRPTTDPTGIDIERLLNVPASFTVPEYRPTGE